MRIPLAAVNSGGAIAPPTVAFSASPTSMTSGKISIVTWSSTNATSCTAAGGWTGTKPTSGTLAVSPTSTTTYTLTCTGCRRHVPSGQCDGGGECRRRRSTARADRRTARRHCLHLRPTFAQPVRRRPWQARAHGRRQLQVAPPRAAATSQRRLRQQHPTPDCQTPTPTPTPDTRHQVLLAGTAACSWAVRLIFCETFDKKNPGIPSRTGDLDPNVWGVSRATGQLLILVKASTTDGRRNPASDLQWDYYCHAAQ